jgi:hypothetical protein
MKISRSVVVVAPVGGVLLGVLDFVWIKFVPSPFAELGNSIAVWAVAAFLLTFGSRWGAVRSIVGAVVFLVVATPSYYLAAALIQHDDWVNLYNSNAILWMALGVVAGAVFGAGGVLARAPGRLQTVALALPGSVLFAEALIEVRRAGDPSYGTSGPISFATLLIVLGLLVTLLVSGDWSRRGSALLYAVPITAAGSVLLALAGFA